MVSFSNPLQVLADFEHQMADTPMIDPCDRFFTARRTAGIQVDFSPPATQYDAALALRGQKFQLSDAMMWIHSKDDPCDRYYAAPIVGESQ